MDFDELIKQGKIKRIFRAKSKLTTPNLVSHITQRAAGKDSLFIEDVDYLCMIANMKDIAQKRSLDIYAFCLMPNHIHMLVSPREDELQEPMRDLFSRYAMWFNRKYERKGHLFGGPYRQSVCLDDTYLLAASLYIHMNPARAGLVTHPLEFRWSSVNLYYNQEAPASFIKPGFILGLLADDDCLQKKTYLNLLNRSISLGKEDILEHAHAVKKLQKGLGQVFPAVFSRIKNKNQIKQHSGLDLLAEEQLDQRIEDLMTRSSGSSPDTRKARRFLIEQLIARGYKRQEIAYKLGISVKTVYNTLRVSNS